MEHVQTQTLCSIVLSAKELVKAEFKNLLPATLAAYKEKAEPQTLPLCPNPPQTLVKA